MPRATELLRFSGWLALVALTVFCWRVMTADTIWDFVATAPQQAADIFGRMLPPRWSYAERLWRPLWDTINMATMGTLLAIILATPVAFLAARNTTPSVALIAAARAPDHCVVALDQRADLGLGPGDHSRSGRARRNHRHCAALHRLHRQVALRGDRGDRREPGRSHPCHRSWSRRRS